MEGEREGEKHQCVIASHTPPTGDLAHNPGIALDQELNQRHFDLQASTQSTEPQQPGQNNILLKTMTGIPPCPNYKACKETEKHYP